MMIGSSFVEFQGHGFDRLVIVMLTLAKLEYGRSVKAVVKEMLCRLCVDLDSDIRSECVLGYDCPVDIARTPSFVL